MKDINFIQWLKKQDKRKDPVGDLAGDIKADRDFPNCNNCRDLRQYLVSVNACDGAMKALDKAYIEFCKLEA